MSTGASSMTVLCESCGEVMPRGLRVCGECGSPLVTVPVLPVTVAPVADQPSLSPSLALAAPASDLTSAAHNAPEDDGATAAVERDVVERDVAEGDVTGLELLDALIPEHAPEPEPVSVIPALSTPGPDAQAHTALVSARPAWGTSRRGLLFAAAGSVAVVLVCGGVWWGLSASGTSSPVTSPSTMPSASEAAVVTLPGWATAPVWEEDVSAVAVAGSRVIGVSGTHASVWDAATGDLVGDVDVAGEDVRVLSGALEGTPVLVAWSSVEAVVFAENTDVPVRIPLTAGETVGTRSGAVVFSGPDFSFRILTPTGAVPVVAPRPQMIVLSSVGGQVLWAGSPQKVVTASANGAVMSDAALQPPAEGATVTAKTGWVRASTATVIITGWTLPDGSTVTAAHSPATGVLLGKVPGSGDGLLAPDGTEWVVNGNRIDLTTGDITPLPTGFIPSQFLDTALSGAVTGGHTALLHADDEEPASVPASTVLPVAIASDTLLTFTNGHLAAFPPAPDK